MKDFFRGWRRKIGLVLLAMALLLTVGMLRSFVIQDEYWTILGGRMYGTDSANGEWAIFREAASDYDMRGCWYVHVGYRHAGQPQGSFTLPSYAEQWHRSAGGVSLRCFVNQTGELNRLGQPRTFHVLRGPHWELVLVLTLFAAALILPSRRRVNRGNECSGTLVC